jgi:hypothetical protein
MCSFARHDEEVSANRLRKATAENLAVCEDHRGKNPFVGKGKRGPFDSGPVEMCFTCCWCIEADFNANKRGKMALFKQVTSVGPLHAKVRRSGLRAQKMTTAAGWQRLITIEIPVELKKKIAEDIARIKNDNQARVGRVSRSERDRR